MQHNEQSWSSFSPCINRTRLLISFQPLFLWINFISFLEQTYYLLYKKKTKPPCVPAYTEPYRLLSPSSAIRHLEGLSVLILSSAGSERRIPLGAVKHLVITVNFPQRHVFSVQQARAEPHVFPSVGIRAKALNYSDLLCVIGCAILASYSCTKSNDFVFG